MKLSVKNRADGSVIQIEIDQNETIGDLRSKIASQLGNSVDAHSIRLSLGAEELNHDDSVVIKKSGLVSGDRLFLESGASESRPAKSEGPDHMKPTTAREDDASMKSDDDSDPVGDFRDRVVRAARNYLEDSGYSNSSLQSWSSNGVAGAEMKFERRARNSSTEIFVLITALSQPNLCAIVNVGRTVDLSRKLLSSFTVQQASVKDNVINGVATALSGSGATGITLVHLFSLRCIREAIMNHMDPRTVIRVSGVNRLLRSVLLATSVDRTYWMRALSRDFGQEKVQEAQKAGGSFRLKYQEEYSRRKSGLRYDPLMDDRFAPLIPGVPPTFPRAPRPDQPNPPRYPHGPLFPAPDPLQPIPNPMNPPPWQPPGANPHGPLGGEGPFGGRNPFDPFDPSNREIFPGRPNQGVPRGGPRYFPANRWDRNDFI